MTEKNEKFCTNFTVHFVQVCFPPLVSASEQRNLHPAKCSGGVFLYAEIINRLWINSVIYLQSRKKQKQLARSVPSLR